jgi:hypothetical protein
MDVTVVGEHKDPSAVKTSTGERPVDQGHLVGISMGGVARQIGDRFHHLAELLGRSRPPGSDEMPRQPNAAGVEKSTLSRKAIKELIIRTLCDLFEEPRTIVDHDVVNGCRVLVRNKYFDHATAFEALAKTQDRLALRFLGKIATGDLRCQALQSEWSKSFVHKTIETALVGLSLVPPFVVPFLGAKLGLSPFFSADTVNGVAVSCGVLGSVVSPVTGWYNGLCRSVFGPLLDRLSSPLENESAALLAVEKLTNPRYGDTGKEMLRSLYKRGKFSREFSPHFFEQLRAQLK